MSRIPRPPIGLVCALALGLACFGGVFFRGEQFAYRDAAHFYYPLYQRVQQEWAAGRLPLWEPEENGGMPLLGNPTAAVLYPGKLIYAALPYAWAARVYVVSHLIWAMVGMFWLLRSWRVSRDGSWLGTLAYGFGVPVLFQYCNVIFLVGAAWAPHGLRGADRWLRLGQWWGLGELAIALAMQTLGGDPQAAYVVGLCAGGYAIALAGTHRADLGKAPPQSRAIGWKVVGAIAAWTAVTLVCAAKFPAFRAREKPPVVLPWTPYLGGVIALGWGILAFNLWRRSRRREANRAFLPMLFGLGAAGCLAIALTAAQLIPVLEFTRLSVRASGAGPHDMFPFSLEPYRLAELIWPNIYGTSYGTNRSWLPALPPAHTTRLWFLRSTWAVSHCSWRSARSGFGQRGPARDG